MSRLCWGRRIRISQSCGSQIDTPLALTPPSEMPDSDDELSFSETVEGWPYYLNRTIEEGQEWSSVRHGM